ncbi:hypothetical protein K2173_016017 [Erythroxylum novogranatense]|uniref:F-box associated beta-propeller type 1 domain-containing protein n=1 Tax=Erythroxylum novogranatense TaxID=1862640 RepID=A0AAV8SF15_9ROSI|nr:hypothetical protein K2173_016017 [Erythroxylum novogranatense]
MEDGGSLHLDMVFQILTSCSLQTLAKCRTLSRECNSMTSDTPFMNLLLQRTGVVSGFFVQTIHFNSCYSTFVSRHTSNHNPSLDFLPVHTKIAASGGLVLLLGINDKGNHKIPKYYVCKPCTKQWQRIPNPKTRFFTKNIGMIVLRSNPLRYKIVRFSEHKFPSLFFKNKEAYYFLRCEVFDSDTWAWKELEDVKLQYGEFLAFRPPVPARGSLHWVTTGNNVLGFDPNNETHTIFSLPEAIIEDSDSQESEELVPYEGKLGFIRNRKDSCMELWVMERKNCEVAWNKRPSINLEDLSTKESFWSTRSFYNADTTLLEGFYKMIFYNIKDGKIDSVSMNRILGQVEIFPFLSDFEVVDLKTRKESGQAKSHVQGPRPGVLPARN